MKIALFALAALTIIIAIPLIVAIFLKKDYSIVREIIINRPKQEVFDYIKYLKNQEKWSIWAKTDPNMKTSCLGTDGTVGFMYSWESDNKRVGKGKQEIKKIVDGEYIEYIEWDLRYAGNPYAQCDWTTERVLDNDTRMKWRNRGRLNYPMNLMILFFEKLMGNDTLLKELASLKTTIESLTNNHKTT